MTNTDKEINELLKTFDTAQLLKAFEIVMNISCGVPTSGDDDYIPTCGESR